MVRAIRHPYRQQQKVAPRAGDGRSRAGKPGQSRKNRSTRLIARSQFFGFNVPRFIDDKFWSKVQVTDTCWLWTASRSTHGYGQLSRKGKVYRAHRYCYEQWHGVKLRVDQHLLHSCDNPLCVNPEHLSVGSHAQNMRECSDRHRIQNGSGHYIAKLTEQTALDIRANYLLCRVTMQELADRFGVSLTTVSNVINCRTWQHSLPTAG